MAKILATDLDGTLLYPKKITRCIPKRNVKFLREWIDKGNRLVLVTSRGLSFIDRLEKEIERPVDAICCTSSVIRIDGKIIKDKWIPNKIMVDVVDRINKQFKPHACLLTTENYPLVILNNSITLKPLMYFYKLFWYFQLKAREPFILNKHVFYDEIQNGKPYKMMLFYGLRRKNRLLSKQINKIIREEIPEIESSWSIMINEITPKDCNKGNGLKEYCEYLSADPKDIYVVGDSGNDIMMFKYYNENSYVMRKAYPSVKKYAKHTISRVYKLRKLLKEENND